MAASIGRCLSAVRQLKNHLKTSKILLSCGDVVCQPVRSAAGVTFSQIQEQTDHNPVNTLFRTKQSDPCSHTKDHTGLYFELSDDDFKRYFKKGPHPIFEKMCVAFNEHSVMVRDPAVEIFDCFRQTDLSLPNVRYIIYGPLGVGKSITMGHVMTYCGRQGWVVVHFPKLDPFIRYPKEVQASGFRKGRVDTPVDCAEWLNYFYTMNSHLTSQIMLSETYVWSKRDSSEAGSPLSQLIEFGLSRSKYATDVMGALLKELRIQSTNGNIKTLVTVDGVNELWLPSKISKIENRTEKYVPEDLNTVLQIRKMLNNDWSGGAVVVTVDTRNAYSGQKASFLPRYLLSKPAMDLFEPHIPVQVMNYDAKEARSCLEYLKDRKWIQKKSGYTPEGQREILFLSSQNPLETCKVCYRW